MKAINLRLSWFLRAVEFMIIMTGSMAASWHGSGVVVEILHLTHRHKAGMGERGEECALAGNGLNF